MEKEAGNFPIHFPKSARGTIREFPTIFYQYRRIAPVERKSRWANPTGRHSNPVYPKNPHPENPENPENPKTGFSYFFWFWKKISFFVGLRRGFLIILFSFLTTFFSNIQKKPFFGVSQFAYRSTQYANHVGRWWDVFIDSLRTFSYFFWFSGFYVFFVRELC